MNHETLRVLFERLCDQLEDYSGPCHFHFQGGFGLEYPQGVVMIFVFEKMTLVFRFSASEVDQISALDEQAPISADECLHMTEELQQLTGGFQELFSGTSIE